MFSQVDVSQGAWHKRPIGCAPPAYGSRENVPGT